jgi:hypothetical protein
MLGVSITEALKLMSDDTHDDMINLDDPSEYEDPASHGLLPRSQTRGHRPK